MINEQIFLNDQITAVVRHTHVNNHNINLEMNTDCATHKRCYLKCVYFLLRLGLISSEEVEDIYPSHPSLNLGN